MKGQIQHLENLVVDMIKRQAASPSLPEEVTPNGPGNESENGDEFDSLVLDRAEDKAEPKALSGSFGRISVADGETNYVGPWHWAAISDHISQIKDLFGSHTENETGFNEQSTSTGPLLLVDSSKVPTKAEILSSIPPRPVTDRLMSCYLNSMEAPTCMSNAVHPNHH